MNIVFLPIAYQELVQAVEFYDQQLSGLGALFYNEIISTVDLIQAYPEGFQKITKQTHKCTLRRFPYLVLYGIVDKSIVITAIAHQHRRPHSYLNRL